MNTGYIVQVHRRKLEFVERLNAKEPPVIQNTIITRLMINRTSSVMSYKTIKSMNKPLLYETSYTHTQKADACQ